MSLKLPSRPSANAGFSLVEIAIVIVIAGMLLTLFSGSLVTMVKNSKLKTTQTRLKEIDETIRAYASSRKRLPCVASWSVPFDDPNYAKETCPAGTAGTENSNGVQIGMVPTRSLNLPDEYGYDAWGSRFVYAVTRTLTDTGSYNLSDGAISIVGNDRTTSLIDPAGKGTYLVFSVGEDKGGGRNAEGYSVADCGTGLDNENCDWDNQFLDTYFQSDAAGVNQFDDHMVYSGDFRPASLIPAHAVMAFNLNSCPDGWRALPDAVGRVIIGAGNGYNESVPPMSPTGFSPPVNYPRGVPGGHMTRFNGSFTNADAQRFDNRPPYIAYTYCEKE